MIYEFSKHEVENKSYLPLYIRLKSFISNDMGRINTTAVAGVYVIFNNDYEIMYIGQSKNLASRVTTHIRGKYKNAWKIIMVEVLARELDDAERFLINTLKPIDNILVDQKYNITGSVFSDYFIELDEDGTESVSDEMVDNFVLREEITSIYPSLRLMVASDMQEQLYSKVGNILKVDNSAISGVMSALGYKI